MQSDLSPLEDDKSKVNKHMKINPENRKKFEERHIGPNEQQLEAMLEVIGVASLDTLIEETIPDSIRLKRPLNIPPAQSEFRFLKDFRALAAHNKVFKTYIGQGYYPCITPNVILRNILENPGWYTAYTPYQAEIAQGRLEMLLNFQTMVTGLTGMEIANASLLDEATAAAEAMIMVYNARKGERKNAATFLVDENCFPQTIALLKTRATPLGIALKIGTLNEAELADTDVFGLLTQYPDSNGAVKDIPSLLSAAKKHNVFAVVATDLLALAILTPPGELGADVVVGSAQRFGVAMGYGGPHAGFFATTDAFKRNIPGRIIGVSIDATGKQAYRMALQTREQHIRREKATSNICTSQVLLAVISAAYAVYHGPKGIRGIAERVSSMAALLNAALLKLGLKQSNTVFFDTLRVETGSLTELVRQKAEAAGINFYYSGAYTQISLDETTEMEDLENIVSIFEVLTGKKASIREFTDEAQLPIPEVFARKSTYLEHPVFNSFQSEHEMLRYLKQLENKDLSLAHSMIALGSCTMKLNATSEMLPVTWQEFAHIHPFAPVNQTEGYQQLFTQLQAWLADITGFAAVSLQPNSGAQGEYAGLLVVRAYHESNGEANRKIALIPSSAHGTNPASAVMAGFTVVVVKCDEKGNIALEDLKAKVEQYKTSLGVLMITYPSTHGVFEESVEAICALVHKAGGQVYMDGANMNAQVGLTSPGEIGADVCHLNLHKTFCIPHGGGGPGMGPIGVAAHLAPFLPTHPVIKTGGEKAISALSAAPWGSASILPISYAYISMMGASGLTKATCFAILNANYLKSRLEKFYPVLYSGTKGRCAHEFILDCRAFKAFGIEVEDLAKRLMDYGFHAPTVSFPVAGTLMIEPTESESKDELDRFCAAMIAIRKEIEAIENGQVAVEESVLKNAPHTADVVMATAWDKPYSREEAAFPLPWVKSHKFWPSVSRIDNAYGDRNLVCSCSFPLTEENE